MSSVLQILPSFDAGGVEQTTLLVANALAEQGFTSFVASSGGNMTKKLHPDVIHFSLPLNTKNPVKIFSNSIKLKKIIQDNKIDIVHARSRAPAWSAYFAADSTDASFVTTYHGAYGQNFFKKYYNRVMALGTTVIVASKYMENHINHYYPQANCIQIASGIDTDFFNPDLVNQENVEQLLSSWNADTNTKIILLVGRFTRIKGHSLLLQAVSKSNFKKQLILVFVGDSKNPKLITEIKQIATELSIPCHIHTDVKDLRPFFSAASVVVVPTIKPEAFGRVTVEAMSMQKVVIGNDLGASSEVLNKPDWIFSHDSLSDFTKKIDEAISLNHEDIHQIGQANRLRASTLYNLNNLINDHIKLYKNIINS